MPPKKRKRPGPPPGRDARILTPKDMRSRWALTVSYIPRGHRGREVVYSNNTEQWAWRGGQYTYASKELAANATEDAEAFRLFVQNNFTEGELPHCPPHSLGGCCLPPLSRTGSSYSYDFVLSSRNMRLVLLSPHTKL
jgi:hypothetical protein